MQNFSIIKLVRACFKTNKQTKRSWSRRSANPQQEKPKKTTERPNSRSAENQRKKKSWKEPKKRNIGKQQFKWMPTSYQKQWSPEDTEMTKFKCWKGK